MLQIVEATVGDGTVKECLDSYDRGKIFPLLPKSDENILNNITRFFCI